MKDHNESFIHNFNKLSLVLISLLALQFFLTTNFIYAKDYAWDVLLNGANYSKTDGEDFSLECLSPGYSKGIRLNLSPLSKDDSVHYIFLLPPRGLSSISQYGPINITIESTNGFEIKAKNYDTGDYETRKSVEKGVQTIQIDYNSNYVSNPMEENLYSEVDIQIVPYPFLAVPFISPAGSNSELKYVKLNWNFSSNNPNLGYYNLAVGAQKAMEQFSEVMKYWSDRLYPNSPNIDSKKLWDYINNSVTSALTGVLYSLLPGYGPLIASLIDFMTPDKISLKDLINGSVVGSSDFFLYYGAPSVKPELLKQDADAIADLFKVLAGNFLGNEISNNVLVEQINSIINKIGDTNNEMYYKTKKVIEIAHHVYKNSATENGRKFAYLLIQSCQPMLHIPNIEAGIINEGKSYLFQLTQSLIGIKNTLAGPPVIDSIPDCSTIEGQPYTGPTPSLSSGTLPITWSLVNSPSGMVIDESTGVVSWSDPAVSGSPHTITIRATNVVGNGDESWALTVTTPPVRTLTIDSPANNPYETGDSTVKFVLKVPDGTAYVTWYNSLTDDDDKFTVDNDGEWDDNVSVGKGRNVITFRAYDSGNNLLGSTVGTVIRKDNVQTISLSPQEWAFVGSGLPKKNNGGSEVFVGYDRYDDKPEYELQVMRGLVKFNLDLPGGSDIQSAQLKGELQHSDGYGFNITAKQLVVNWNQDTVSWHDLFGPGDIVRVTDGQSTEFVDDDDVYWDLTEIVKSWVGGSANHGIILEAESSVENTHALRDRGFKGEPFLLSITYSMETTPPTISITDPLGDISLPHGTSSVELRGNAYDSYLAEVSYQNTSSGDSGIASGTSSWSCTVPLKPGNNSITVSAIDNSGNTASKTINVFVEHPQLTVSLGSGSGAYPSGSLVPVSADSAAVGQIFRRWEGNTDYVDDMFSPSTFVHMPDHNITVTATYGDLTYTVSYASNSETGGYLPADQTKTHNLPLTLNGNTGNLVRTSYTFAGWNTAANGSGTDYAAGGTYSANASVTLYAKWTGTNPTISGRVTRSDTGAGMDGVTINFSNNAGTEITSSGGYYLKQVTNGWGGIATPIFSNGSFSPPSQSYGNVTNNREDQNYTWTPDDVVSIPIFNPDGGPNSGDSVTVTVSCATADATIRYTTNGTEPTDSSPTVSSGGTVTVPLPGTLKAKAWKIGMTTSAMKTAVYNISEGNNYTLTVKKTGNGTVTSNPSGVSCGSDCSENYTGGTFVALTATPDVGFTFAGWSGACSGTGLCTVTLDTAKTVIASFNDRAWRRQRYDIGGTNYYPYGSNQNNGQLALKWSKSMNLPDVRTADINNDGFLEVVASNGSQLIAYDKMGNILWSVNTTARLSYIGDADDDGLPEIFVTYRDGSNNLKSDAYSGMGSLIKTLNVGPYTNRSSWMITHNIGDKLIAWGDSAGGSPNARGVFIVSYSTGQKLTFYAQGPVPYSIAIGDVNSDGLLEIASMAGTWHNGVSANGTTDGDIYGIVSNENGAKVFTKIITDWNASTNSNGVLLWMFTDLDNNGTPEMVAMEGHDPTYYPGKGNVYLIDSSGQKTAQWTGPQNPGFYNSYSSADINGDGYKEIIISTESNETIYILDKNLNLLSQSSPGQGLILGITDFDGDGQLELIVNQKGTGIIKVLKKDLSTVISTYDTGGTGFGWHDPRFAISDIDNDGINDIIMVTSNGLHVLSPLAQDASHLLTVNKSGIGGGTITSNSVGIICGADCSEYYSSNTTITLTATPYSGSFFTGWSGDCSGADTCTLSMLGNRQVTATFNLISSQKRVAVINPDSYRIRKMGELQGDGKFYSIASATVADGNNYGRNPANWSGIGVHADFISSVLAATGYIVDQYEAGSMPSILNSDYPAVIIQDPLRSNYRIFDKATENNLPDLLEYVKDEAFLNKIKAYFNSGGNVIFVGDAVRLMEDGSGRLNWGKYISTKSVLNNKSVADSRLSDHWLFVRGGPFCGTDRIGSGQYRVNSSPLFNSGTIISNIAFFDGNDLPIQQNWSDTFYYPSDGTSLLTVDITGSGQYVLIGNVCSPSVHTVQVNETVPHLIGYTTYNGRKVYYIGSDSLFDYHYKNSEGAWHAGQYRSMDYTLTNDGADIISKLVDQALLSGYLLRGDLDGNLTTDLADAILALQLLSGVTPISTVYTEADVNGDGKIGLPDVIYILQKVSRVR